MNDFPIPFFHNPDCSTPCNALAMVQGAGYTPTVVEFLQAVWIRPQIGRLLDAMENVDDQRILTAMLKRPILVNHPIIETPRGTKLCRPSEVVLSILERQRATFTLEDSKVVKIGGSQP